MRRRFIYQMTSKKIRDRKKSLSSLKVSVIELMSWKESVCLFFGSDKTHKHGSGAEVCDISYFSEFLLKRCHNRSYAYKIEKNLRIFPLEVLKLYIYSHLIPQSHFLLRVEGGGRFVTKV